MEYIESLPSGAEFLSIHSSLIPYFIMMKAVEPKPTFNSFFIDTVGLRLKIVNEGRKLSIHSSLIQLRILKENEAIVGLSIHSSLIQIVISHICIDN